MRSIKFFFAKNVNKKGSMKSLVSIVKKGSNHVSSAVRPTPKISENRMAVTLLARLHLELNLA
jgi:hypothetical protein